MTKRSVVAPAGTPKLGIGRREAPRVPADLSCKLSWDSVSTVGSLIDLSLGGAAVGLSQPLPLSPGARLSLELETDDGLVAVEALLVTQAEEAFGTFAARLKFAGDRETPEIQALVAHCTDAFRHRQALVFRKHL